MTQLCLPSLIYLILSIIGIIIYIFSTLFKTNPNYKQNFTTANALLVLIIKLVLMIIWTLLLNWLCSIDMAILAWVILCLPLILFFFVVFIIMKNSVAKELKQ
jgi:cell division protein FtsW (lipid II flippase)